MRNINQNFLCTILVSFILSLNAYAYTEHQFESVLTDEEKKLETLRDQEIDQLKIVMGRRFSENRRPDILLRLAELYTEKYRLAFFKENEIYQALIAKGIKENKVNHTKSLNFLEKASNSCLAILKSKVHFSKIDQVYYFLGYNYLERGQQKSAEHYFELVIRKYPDSQYAVEAYRNLAEFAFDKKKYSNAVKLYEKAAQITTVPSYPRTLYKLSWAYFKVRRHDDALQTLKKVVVLSTSETRFVGLKEEALRDLVLFFAEAGRYQEAHSYFEKISGGADLYIKSLTRLSSIYEKEGKYRQALAVNKGLIFEYADKKPELVFEVLNQTVQLHHKLKEFKEEEAALGRLVQYYIKYSDKILDLSSDSESSAYAAFLQSKTFVRNKATDLHKEAQRKNSVKLYSKSADYYALYLQAFIDAMSKKNDEVLKDQSQIRVYYADALIAAEREKEALQVLEKIFDEDKNTKTKKQAGTTALNLLIKKIDKNQKKSEDFEVNKNLFLSFSKKFEDEFAQDPLVPELKYKKARLEVIEKGSLTADIRGTFVELVQKYPSREESLDAARDLLNDSLKRKDQEQVLQYAKQFLGNHALLKSDKSGEFKKYLNTLVSRDEFSKVQGIEKENNYLKAAQEYERLGLAKNSDPELQYKAIHNAAVNYEKAENKLNAAKMYLSIFKKFPKKKKETSESLLALPLQLILEGQYSTAAQLYGQYGLQSEYDAIFTDEERLNFSKTGFQLLQGTQEIDKAKNLAEKTYHNFCKIKKNLKPCYQLAFEIASFYKENKHYEDVLSFLKSFLQNPNNRIYSSEANYKIAEIYSLVHNDKKAHYYYEQAIKQSTKKGKTERSFVAHSALKLIGPLFEHYQNIELKLPEEALKALTQKKLKTLQALVSKYEEVVKYGDGQWGIVALQELAKAYLLFANELISAPVPDRIRNSRDDKLLKLYEAGIQKVAGPLKNKAQEYLEKANDLGEKLEITSPEFALAHRELAYASPEKYPLALYVPLENINAQRFFKILGIENRKPAEEWRSVVQNALIANPKSSQYWTELANLEFNSGNEKVAKIFYEQALIFNRRYAPALNNIAILLFSEQKYLEATQAFLQASEAAELNADIAFNLSKIYLCFLQFPKALENLKSLASRNLDSNEILDALAVAYLGSGQISKAGALLSKLDAENSDKFNLWFNWSVWALYGGSKDDKQKAVHMIHSNKSKFPASDQEIPSFIINRWGKI